MSKARFYLDREMLVKHGVCEPAQNWFWRNYGNRTEVTPEFLAAAEEQGYLSWLLYRIYGPADKWPEDYHRARMAYLDADVFHDDAERAAYEQAQIDAILNAPLLKDRPRASSLAKDR